MKQPIENPMRTRYRVRVVHDNGQVFYDNFVWADTEDRAYWVGHDKIPDQSKVEDYNVEVEKC